MSQVLLQLLNFVQQSGGIFIGCLGTHLGAGGLLILANNNHRYQNQLQKVENDIVRKERDEWRNLALKAISRNFNYVDILLKGHDYKNDSAVAPVGGNDQR